MRVCVYHFFNFQGHANLFLFFSFKSLFFLGGERKTQWNGTYRRVMDIGGMGYGMRWGGYIRFIRGVGIVLAGMGREACGGGGGGSFILIIDFSARKYVLN